MAGTVNGSPDLHENVPDHSGIVLLIVDVINDLDFPDNKQLVRHSGRLADSVGLKRRCKSLGIPAIYVNDNRGRWRSDLQEVIRFAGRKDAPGKHMVEKLTPSREDYVILRPKHSAFFATPLELILQHLGAHTVVIAGIITNACVLISAGDVFLRGFRLFVPSDCVAALTQETQSQALNVMKDNFNADTTPSSHLDLEVFAGSQGTADRLNHAGHRPKVNLTPALANIGGPIIATGVWATSYLLLSRFSTPRNTWTFRPTLLDP